MTDVAGTDVPTAGADSLEALMGRTNSDADAVIHTVRDNADVIFTWSYDKGERASLSKLYEKAKGSQWNGTTDLPWETEVDQESFARSLAQMDAQTREARGTDLSGTVFAKWGTREWEAQAFELQNWTLSQFLHGEQGALACSAKIVETVPWIDAKYYASTQVMDEARHVEVFARYLDEKMSGHYPVNVHLRELLDDILSDSRWDMTYLGMQIMVEGLALASFGMAHAVTPCPLLRQLLRYVMSDEARHVAFGVLSLAEYYQQLTEAELLERQEFAFEAAVRMRDRFMAQEMWERLGVPPGDAARIFAATPEQKNKDPFQQLLFSKIVPNCKKLGLLDANDGWLRKRFDTLGVSQFEDWADTSTDYEVLDEVSKDRSAASAD
ncbi:MAG: ferritin-like domain-containing protein [Microthrixaceae bacterium]|nr:ferritin-like domain-containing protein [Microthrixaceae bacterium]